MVPRPSVLAPLAPLAPSRPLAPSAAAAAAQAPTLAPQTVPAWLARVSMAYRVSVFSQAEAPEAPAARGFAAVPGQP